MCLIVFGWDIHPKYKLILAANRDEFYHRSTAPAEYWPDHPEILGGRDLEAGGTWLAVSKSGKVAAVTNYRDPNNNKPKAASRGEIPVNFLKGTGSAENYVEMLHADIEKYNGFNVLVGDMESMFHYSNYERKLNKVDRGVHGLSNALLNTSWPKVERAKERFGSLIDGPFQHDDLIDLMGDTEMADDAILPETGVRYEIEKALSAMCIRMEGYGTRCTTVITVDRMGVVDFTEKTHVPEAAATTKIVRHRLQW